jgi:hypothetical protein
MGAGKVNFNTAALRKLRNTLSSKRDAANDRFDFVFTMRKWKLLVKQAREANRHTTIEPLENEVELVAYLCDIPREAVDLTDDELPIRGKGRPRADLERYAALLLAMIFHEYTGRKPTRVTMSDRVRTFDRDETSPFYQFATACFEAIGLKPREDAFREATERWEQSVDFSKNAMQIHIWGDLRGVDGRSHAPEFKCNTKPLRPRIISPRLRSKPR